MREGVKVGETGSAALGASGAARSAMLLVATALVVVLSSCSVPPSDQPTAGPTPSTAARPSVSAAPEPEPEPDPELVAGGTAQQNKPYFDFVASGLTADGNPGGRAIIDGLVAAGFDKSRMQVTADRTPLGNAVDSLQFSVEFDEECLIGQAGVGTYTGIVAPVLEAGGCLIGDTRTIDW